MLPAVFRLQVRPCRGVAAPDFVDVRAFVTAHVLVVRELLLEHRLVDEAADSGFGKLSGLNAPFVLQLLVDGSGREPWIGMFEIANLFLQFLIDFPADATVGAAGRDEVVKAAMFVVQLPTMER